MNKQSRYIGKAIVIAALLLSLQSCFADYSAEAIEGWLVDEDTGKPIEGANVTANWTVEEGNLAGTNTGGQIQILETVTDKNGRFFFPAWGPKPLPPKKNGWWVDQYIGYEDPRMVFFKSGYKLVSASNYAVSERNTARTRRSEWNGKTIKMKNLADQKKEYEESLSAARSALRFAFDASGCDWQHIPRMLAAVIKEMEKLRQPGKYNPLLTVDVGSIPETSQCARPQDYLREYLK
ncbi:carboxypeptidase-like regulatory domain-containing protein [Ramlibacter sp. WS9]|uniref:carboxypeptidase-like regulatory domain-containing protein n=1 Tax=Ramlibacter sp. WS9 TaxID=1882741 RepID=UPI001144F74C|nr:carboxypeptidase-like regulatory domain-containing protein [Ramlibacter sp. WS9]ROZ76072.1 hypothetical protein EEB15_12970 [Ramlibacter sp. WS9]